MRLETLSRLIRRQGFTRELIMVAHRTVFTTQVFSESFFAACVLTTVVKTRHLEPSSHSPVILEGGPLFINQNVCSELSIKRVKYMFLIQGSSLTDTTI